MTLRTTAIRTLLDTLHVTGMHRLSTPVFGGLGAILMFHRVRPPRDDAFQPNAFLEVTPEFLEQTIRAVRQRGIEIVSIDEACDRIRAGASEPRFAVLTFDDGYRDNLEYAVPILEREKAPFTIYVTTDFAEGTGKLWWIALEEVIAANDEVVVPVAGRDVTVDGRTAEAKAAAYGTIVRLLRSSETGTRDLAVSLAERYAFDFAGQGRDTCMTWAELTSVSESDLCTLGAHTVTHPSLARLSDEAALREMREGAERMADKLGSPPRHFAYPHGGPADAGGREFKAAADLGFVSAVTTRHGVIYPDHSAHMTALPRISVNGLFQAQRYLDVMLSGASTAIGNRFARVNAA